MSVSTSTLYPLEDDSGRRPMAVDYLSEAFAEAIIDGVDVGSLANAAIIMSLRELIAIHGEGYVIDFLLTLTESMDAGTFLPRRCH